MSKPEALRLAEQLEAIGLHGPVAAELRRLHAERVALLAAANYIDALGGDSTSYRAVAELRRLSAVEAQRDALLEALRLVYATLDQLSFTDAKTTAARLKARAAIKAVEEGK